MGDHPVSEIIIRLATRQDKPEWLRMRLALWPEHAPDEHCADLDKILADPMQPTFVAVRGDGRLGGFLEAGTRNYAEGCATSPVGYIEGWYVDEDLRRQGLGRRLMQAAEEWARAQGLVEMASDTWLENEDGIQVHTKLGYRETERLVQFVKKL
jgi:aminoglycoside 6'-N-acetyltransferase I